ncbi:unnamed protein product, partial [Phaeothamnion confervicola]
REDGGCSWLGPHGSSSGVRDSGKDGAPNGVADNAEPFQRLDWQHHSGALKEYIDDDSYAGEDCHYVDEDGQYADGDGRHGDGDGLYEDEMAPSLRFDGAVRDSADWRNGDGGGGGGGSRACGRMNVQEDGSYNHQNGGGYGDKGCFEPPYPRDGHGRYAAPQDGWSVDGGSRSGRRTSFHGGSYGGVAGTARSHGRQDRRSKGEESPHRQRHGLSGSFDGASAGEYSGQSGRRSGGRPHRSASAPAMPRPDRSPLAFDYNAGHDGSEGRPAWADGP